MTQYDSSAVAAPDGSAQMPVTRRGGLPTVAIWLSAIALVLCCALGVPYLALRDLALVPVFVLAAAAAVMGLVLGIRERRGVASSRIGTRWALICSLVALVIDVVLLVVFIVGIVSASSINRVELDGQGPTNMSATISSDQGTNTYTWPSNSWARLSTKGSWAELTLVAPTGSTTKELSCQIRWNDEVVVEKTSDSGTVTCRYDAK